MILPSVWTICLCGFCLTHFVLSTCEKGIVLTLFSENLRAVLGRSTIQENVFFLSLVKTGPPLVRGHWSHAKVYPFGAKTVKFCPRRVTSCSYRPTHLYPSWICQSVVYLNWTRSCFNVVIFVFTGWLVNDHQSGSCECHLQNNNLQVLSRNSHWAVSFLTLDT